MTHWYDPEEIKEEARSGRHRQFEFDPEVEDEEVIGPSPEFVRFMERLNEIAAIVAGINP